MTTLGIDYAWTHPNAQAIYDAGYRAVLRYLSNDASKDLSVAEAKALHAAGLGIGLVWETTASRAGAGQAAGRTDATTANAKADALGFPDACPIFYAVDYDATPELVAPYFTGVTGVPGRPVGVYGSYRVVKAMMAGPAVYGWQTMAWSGGLILASAHLLQRLTHTWPIAGVPSSSSVWDENLVQHPFPLWTPTTQEATMSAAEVQEIKDYVRALLVDHYTVLGVDHPGVAKVVEENQKRITALAAGLERLVQLVGNATPTPPAPAPVVDQATLTAALREVLAQLVAASAPPPAP